jgi:hypothetical protein
MPRLRPQFSLLPLLLLVLSACATLGVPSATTFNQRALAAQTAATAAVSTSTVLLNAHKIGSADAENVQKQADLVKESVDVARSIHATDPKGGETKLDSTVTILKALEAYLARKQ